MTAHGRALRVRRIFEATVRETRTVAFVFWARPRRLVRFTEYFCAEMNVTGPDSLLTCHSRDSSRMALQVGGPRENATLSSVPFIEMCAYKSSRLHAVCAAKVGLKRTASG